MSVNDLADTAEAIAMQAAFEAKALYSCDFHKDMVIRVGDPDAEKLAYAYATNLTKREDRMFMRDDVMDAVKSVLDGAADGDCPRCEDYRHA